MTSVHYQVKIEEWTAKISELHFTNPIADLVETEVEDAANAKLRQRRRQTAEPPIEHRDRLPRGKTASGRFEHLSEPDSRDWAQREGWHMCRHSCFGR